MDTLIISISYLWLLKCCCLYELVISFPLVIFPEKELLCHLKVLFSISIERSIMFTMMATPSYPPLDLLFSTPSPTLVTYYFFMESTMKNVRWYLIVVFIFISLLIYDFVHLFTYMRVTHMPSLKTCLFRSFFYLFLLRLFVFLLLSYVSSSIVGY
jgi:hypothetical protein